MSSKKSCKDRLESCWICGRRMESPMEGRNGANPRCNPVARATGLHLTDHRSVGETAGILAASLRRVLEIRGGPWSAGRFTLFLLSKTAQRREECHSH